MSSNTSKGRGEKGSKFWMQAIPNTALKAEVDNVINANLTWLSPLKSDNYSEYELRAKSLESILGYTDRKACFGFWPNRQPQWDGIAFDEQTLYLVEAKSYPKEMNSTSKASEKSKKQIEAELRDLFEQHYKSSFENIEIANERFEKYWLKDYYQLANRLLFLNRMQGKGKYKEVKLVLVNFVDDYTHSQTTRRVSKHDWETHYKEVFVRMTGREVPPNDVIVVYQNVDEKYAVI